MRDMYKTVSDKIAAELAAGAAPWIKPWSATPGQNVPCNAVTNRPYSGVNVLLLWAARGKGYASPRYLTFKQAKEAGGNVRKGEHGETVFFVKRLVVKDKNAAPDSDEHKAVTMLRAYTVFNVAQCENLPERIVLGKVAPIVRNGDERDATVDEFLSATKADIREGHGEAYYIPSQDYISLPAFAAFRSAAHFYNVSFHELAHWTGAKSRLNRDFSGRFGSNAYAAEELVAELAAAFLCAEFDIDGELRSAGYIATWIKLLKDDSRAFFTAASKAQAAADYLRGLVLADDNAELAEAA